MMKITAIKQTKAGFYALFLDGAFAFSVDGETVLSCHLRQGLEISREELAALLDEAQYKRLRSKALGLLGRADCSKKALIQKLARYTEDEDLIARVADAIEQAGYVNDQNYAESLSRYYLNEKKVSYKKAFYEMQRKGVGRELAQQVLDAMDRDEREIVRQALLKRTKGRSVDRDGARKLFAALARQGFPYEEINSVIREYIQEMDNDQED